MTNNEAGDWSEYQRLVMSELRQLRDDLKSARSEINEIRVEMTTLKVKSGLWGLLAGAVPGAIAVFLHFFGRKD